MGYVVLVKGQSFKTQVERVDGNTIFEIRYDFDLGGAEVTIPGNCTLKFEGGSICNGDIDFNNCIIDADMRAQIFCDIDNFYNVGRVSVMWFGAKGDNINDDTSVFQNILNKTHFTASETPQFGKKNFELFLPCGIYKVTGCLNESAYENTALKANCIYGEGIRQASEYLAGTFIGSSTRSIIRCIGTLGDTPFLYCPLYMEHISMYGENLPQDPVGDYQRGWKPKYSDSLALSTKDSTDSWHNNGNLNDVQICYFGTGLLQHDTYVYNSNNLYIARCYYGYIISGTSDKYITHQYVSSLLIEFCKRTALYINYPNAQNQITFRDCTIQFSDLDYIGTEDTEYHIKTIDGSTATGMYSMIKFENLYLEAYYTPGTSSRDTPLCSFSCADVSNSVLYLGKYLFGDKSTVRNTNAKTANLSFSKKGSIENTLFGNYEGTNVYINNSIQNKEIVDGTEYFFIPYYGAEISSSSTWSLSRVKTWFKNRPRAPLFFESVSNGIYGKCKDTEFDIPVHIGQTIIKTPDRTDSGGIKRDKCISIDSNYRIYVGWSAGQIAVDAMGRSFHPLYGDTIPTTFYANRDEGFVFFDTSKNKPIWWRSSGKWVEADSAKEGVARSGTKAQRPSGADIYVGFQYMQVDTTNGTFPIWASAISGTTVTWVKADGTNPDT